MVKDILYALAHCQPTCSPTRSAKSVSLIGSGAHKFPSTPSNTAAGRHCTSQRSTGQRVVAATDTGSPRVLGPTSWKNKSTQRLHIQKSLSHLQDSPPRLKNGALAGDAISNGYRNREIADGSVLEGGSDLVRESIATASQKTSLQPQLRRIGAKELLRPIRPIDDLTEHEQREREATLVEKDVRMTAGMNAIAEEEIPRGARDNERPGEEVVEEEAIIDHVDDPDIEDNPADIEANMWETLGAHEEADELHGPNRIDQIIGELAAEEAREAHMWLDDLSTTIDNLDSIAGPFTRGRDAAIVARAAIVHVRGEVNRITQSATRTIQQLHHEAYRLNDRIVLLDALVRVLRSELQRRADVDVT